MAKQGMKRPTRTHTKPHNEQAAVPEIQGRGKTGKSKANPIIAGTDAPSQKVYHTTPHSNDKSDSKTDNRKNDIPETGLNEP